MELLQGNGLFGADISAAVSLDTYTADADRELLVNLCLSGLAGGGMYRACLTRQIEGVGPFYQSPTSVVAVSSGVTSVILSTSPLAVKSSDVLAVFVQGLAGDTAVNGVVEWFDVTAAKAGAEMTLADDAITAAKFDEATAFPLTAEDDDETELARVGKTMVIP
jgi:hypothetical protein